MRKLMICLTALETGIGKSLRLSELAPRGQEAGSRNLGIELLPKPVLKVGSDVQWNYVPSWPEKL